MAFKMKGPSLYQNGALGKTIKVQKDYSGKEDGRATSSPLQQLVPEPPPQIPQKIQPASPVQQTAKQAPPRKKAKTSFKNKAKAAWYTEMHHDGGKSSTAEKWKTYKGKKKEFRKAKKTGEDVSWKSGY